MLDKTRLAKLAESQLEHVLLALRDGDRAYNVRDVLDPWWCYERGEPFVKVRRDGGYTAVQFNNPDPATNGAALRRFDGVSVGAEAIISHANSEGNAGEYVGNGKLVVDHAVPIKVIKAHLWKHQCWTLADLRSLLRSLYKRVVLSAREDAVLNRCRLRSAMPTSWELVDDPFERYRYAQITLMGN